MQKIGIIGGSDSDAAEFIAALQQQQTWDAIHERELDFIIESTTPEVLSGEGLVLVCDSEAQERAFRPLLDRRGLSHVGTRVAAPAPTYRPEVWTAKMSAAKEAYGRQLHRQHRGPAHTAPTTKARKAARKRARAGRKASR